MVDTSTIPRGTVFDARCAMAVDPGGRVAGHPRHAPPLHAGGRQDPARPRAARQPLVEHDAPCHRPGTHHIADASSHRSGVPDRLRLPRAPARHHHRQRRRALACTRGPSGRRVPRHGHVVARRARGEHHDLAGAGRDPGRGPLHRRSCPRQLRPRRGPALLARARRDPACLRGLPCPLRRQGQSGAPVLGRPRPRLHEVLRAPRAPAPRRRTELRSARDVGGVLPRGQQLRVLAGPARRGRGVLRLRLPGSAWLPPRRRRTGRCALG
jgi:hypothetical protein